MRQRVQGLRNGKADGGFTLIELLIVIVVLGILAGIVVFGVQTVQDDAQEAACKADVRTVQTAVEAYRAQNEGNIPTMAQLTGAAEPYLRSTPASVQINATTGAVTGTGC
jgi:prepilin-type N-terminal cleavage/methylation domain-containing protein